MTRDRVSFSALDTDVPCTDLWVSMGREGEAENRLRTQKTVMKLLVNGIPATESSQPEDIEGAAER